MSVARARANLERVLALAVRQLSERFDRGGGPGRPPAEIAACNQYQHDLTDAYNSWADDAAKQLAAETDRAKRDALLATLLLLLLASLRDLANAELPNAIALGLGGTPGSPAVYQQVAKVMAENEAYLENSFIPAVRAQMLTAINDPALLAALDSGNTATAQAALDVAAKLLAARLAQYAGSWWKLMNYAIGQQAANLGMRIRWTRDAQAKHCGTCLKYGEREYDSFADLLAKTGGVLPADGTACGGNCRCILELVGAPRGRMTRFDYRLA
jgi:hypothetical protein